VRDRPGSETFAAHLYTIREVRQSRFDRDATLTIDVALMCPRCKTRLSLLDHGKSQKCSKCSLRMELYGNGLTVWE
jgi:transcription initiation factor IIE alpha subunit